MVASTAAFKDEFSQVPNTGSVVQGVFLNNKVRLSSNRAVWAVQLRERFEEITRLRPGWDGYRGQAVSFANAYFAMQLLERICLRGLLAPSVVPGGDGTVQLEWHKNQFDIELDVLAPNVVRATRFDQRSDEVQELELETDFTIVLDWLREMKDRAI